MNIQENKLGNLIARVVISIISFVLFFWIFMLSNHQHWPLWITIVLVVFLFIAFNMSFVWLYWQKKKVTLDDEDDDA